MDIERMKRLLKTGIEAGNKVKAVRKVVKTYQTRKQDLYDDTAEILKPSIDVQKSVKESIDKKQDELIEQLKENQAKIVKAIEFNPKQAIAYDGKNLPKLDWDIDEGEDEGEDEEDVIQYDNIEGEDEEVEPSTSEKKPEKIIPILNLDKGMSIEYDKLLEDKGWPLPSHMMKKGIDPNKLSQKWKTK